MLGSAAIAAAAAGPGDLDVSFGSGGRVVTPIDGPGFDSGAVADDVLVQADGKIVAAGSRRFTEAESGAQFLLVRYAADGSRDPGFGDGGVVLGPSSGSSGGSAGVHRVVQQPDRKLVAAGTIRTRVIDDQTSREISSVRVVRYDADGLSTRASMRPLCLATPGRSSASPTASS